MTVDSADRSSATAASTSLTFSHATRDTVQMVSLSVPTVTLSRVARPKARQSRQCDGLTSHASGASNNP